MTGRWDFQISEHHHDLPSDLSIPISEARSVLPHLNCKHCRWITNVTQLECLNQTAERLRVVDPVDHLVIVVVIVHGILLLLLRLRNQGRPILFPSSQPRQRSGKSAMEFKTTSCKSYPSSLRYLGYEIKYSSLWRFSNFVLMSARCTL